MAQIKQIGPGRRTSGSIDGITYVTRNGKTYVRSSPTMPASAYNTPAAKKRQAIFKFIQMHLKYHLRTIKQTFTSSGNGSPSNRYYNLNGKALAQALDSLADQYVDGEIVTLTEIEAAISAYAAQHPQAIVIASKSGYNTVYLTGPWPATITLNASSGDSTVVIYLNGNDNQNPNVNPNPNGNQNQSGNGNTNTGGGGGDTPGGEGGLQEN